MTRLYLNGVTAELSEPINGSVTEWYTSEKDRAKPNKYRLQCLTCQVKWKSETPTDKCWSCGDEKKDPWFSMRGN